MRGGFLHNHVLLDPIEAHFRQLGAATHREHATRDGQVNGFVDLLIDHGDHRIACEAELSTDRVGNDMRKAIAVHATLLLIVVPHPRLASAVRRHLRALSHRGCLPIWVLPLGVALARLRREWPLSSAPNASRKTSELGLAGEAEA